MFSVEPPVRLSFTRRKSGKTLLNVNIWTQHKWKQILYYYFKYLLSNTIQKRMKTMIMKRFYCCHSCFLLINCVYIIVQIIYPKSDEQRQRLGEAVKNILLFRSLDQVWISRRFLIMFLLFIWFTLRSKCLKFLTPCSREK